MRNLTITKSTPFTFSPILIHAAAKDNKCIRDILVSPSMTLYQLHKFILIAFGIQESNVEFHNFTLTHEMMETSYEIIDSQEIDGFITPVAPGVYIEHTHPHEPLPLFSLYTPIHDNTNMTFRMLRDERYCTLDNIPSSEIFYEIQYHRQHYCIQLNLQSVNLPIHFADEINLNPKIINRKGGDFFANNANAKFMLLHYFIPTNENYHYKMNEEWIRTACQTSIDKLTQERKNFLIHGHQKKCEWVEPSGEKCVYCTLSMQ